MALEPLGLVTAELLGALLAGYLIHFLAWRLLRRFARSTSTILDDSKAWDLRCEVREKLVSFLQRQYPSALPKVRGELREGDRPSRSPEA